MQQSTFFKQLSVITLGCILAISALSLSKFTDLQSIAWVSLAFFVLLCFPMYHFSERAMHSEDKFQFTNLFLIFTSSKMFAAIVIVLVYYKLVAPSSNHFLIPFFAIYLIYTIFEIYFLTKISQQDINT